MSADDHGSCPHCGVNLNGGSIWETGLKMAWAGRDGAGLESGPAKTQEEAEARADRYAGFYGATRASGQWGREIGISNWDSIVEWECPDCHGRWPRIRYNTPTSNNDKDR